MAKERERCVCASGSHVVPAISVGSGFSLGIWGP